MSNRRKDVGNKRKERGSAVSGVGVMLGAGLHEHLII